MYLLKSLTSQARKRLIAMLYNFNNILSFRHTLAKNGLIFLFSCILILEGGNHLNAQNSEPYKWNSVAIGGGGFVSAIITEKNEGVIYGRTDVGGAYRFDRTSNKWIPLMDWASDEQQGMFGTESLAIDPKNPNIVYVLAGISYFNSGKTYMLRSIDYGENFTLQKLRHNLRRTEMAWEGIMVRNCKLIRTIVLCCIGNSVEWFRTNCSFQRTGNNICGW